MNVRGSLLLAAFGLVLWLVLQFAGPRGLGNLLYDMLLRMQPALAADEVVLVAVDDRSIEQLGRWPWSRALHADLIDRLAAAGARVIVLDVLFAEASAAAAADARLATAAAASGRLVLPMVLDHWQTGGQLIEVLPYPGLAEATAAIGHAHVSPDGDGVVRGVWLWQGLGSARWPHLALATHLLSRGQSPAPRAAGNMPLSAYGQRDQFVRVPFRPPDSLAAVSFVDVLAGRTAAAQFRDKVVFVGVLASGLGDRHATPATRQGRTIAGVELNAATYLALAGQRLIVTPPQALLLVANLLLALLPALWLPVLRVLRGLTAVLGLVVLAAAGAWLALRLGYWLDLSAGALAALALWPVFGALRLERALRYLIEEEHELGRLIDSTPVSTRANDLNEVLQRLPAGCGIAATRRVQRAPEGVVAAPGWQHDGNWCWLALAEGGFLGVELQVALQVQPGGGQNDSATAATPPLTNAVLARLQARYGRSSDQAAPLDLVARRIAATRRAATAVAALQRFFRSSLAGLSEGVVVIDALHTLVYANEAAQVLAGRMQVGAGLDALTGLDAGVLAAVHLALAQGDADTIEYTRGELFVLASITRVDLGAPWGLAVIVALTDVSRLKQAERTRTESLSFISHDLRSPMVSLLALTQRARHERPGNFEAFLADLERHARANIKLSDEFLQLTRLAETHALALMDFDPAEVVYNVVDQLFPTARAADLELRVLPLDDAQLHWCHGDPEAIERALANLVGNAIKYAPAGKLVEISCRARADRIVYAVRDAGPGIDVEDLPQLFDPWFQARRGRGGAGGSGLGLRYVKLVADRHGGEVRVESRPGHGTTFFLEVPAGEAFEDDEALG